MAYRYLGNKTRLLDWVTGTIGAHVRRGSRIADPMCGTAAVSEALAAAGYSVTASDALTFPVLHAKARLLFTEEPEFAHFGGYAATIDHLNSLQPIDGYFLREFSPAGSPAYGGPPRGYFTPTNAAKIDAVRSELQHLRDAALIGCDERDLLLHDLALAVNDVANIAGTYGYFRSKWNKQSLSELTLVPETFAPTPGTHQVHQADAASTLRQFVGEACYLDPPYTKRQYSGNYHILETIAVGDEPLAHGAGGLRDWRHQASDFCYRQRAPLAFREILDSLTVPHLFVSYSEDGQVPPSELWAILETYGRVQRYELELPRFRSNSAPSRPVREHLYHVVAA